MGQSKPIRVMLVDDHAVVRSGLAPFCWLSTTLNSSARPAVDPKPSPSVRNYAPTSY